MPLPANILVIDDDESIRAGCIQTLANDGHRVQAVESGNEGLAKVSTESFDVVLVDLKMPGISGMDVLKRIKEDDPTSVVIVITGYGTIDAAVEAMKLGAYDFITKPFAPETLSALVETAVNTRLHALEDACIVHALGEKAISDRIVGASTAIKRIGVLVGKVALTDSTVLITGDTGVGKELVARTIHQISPRRDRPFVTVDCGALVEGLFESELFGHTEGAFTGAVKTTQGKFQLGNGGTMFLDEVANISLSLQSRLLRVIEEREISRVGASEKIKLDVRIISATNKDLLEEVRKGEFREDLFYRLNVVPIRIPPLRERRQDIPLLAEYFLKKLREQRGTARKRISADAMRALETREWPGNVRELRNLIERAMVTCEAEVIDTEDLFHDEASLQPGGTPLAKGSLVEREKEEITNTLRQFGGHKAKTAEYLGINRKTLREKIRKYGIEVEP